MTTVSQSSNRETITVRELSMADYDQICAVWAASGLPYKPTGRESREAFQAQLASGVQFPLGAFIGDHIVGVVLATHDSRKGWINRLAVDKDFQRRGVGRALIQAAEALLRAKGLPIVAALVEHHNSASLALFLDEGFHLHETYYLSKRDDPDV